MVDFSETGRTVRRRDDVGTLSQDGVFVQGGTFQAYYMAPLLAHGLWTEQYAMRARREFASNPSVLTVNVRCSPGFIAESDLRTALTGLGCARHAHSGPYRAATTTVCVSVPSPADSAGSVHSSVGRTQTSRVWCFAGVPAGGRAPGAITIEECFAARDTRHARELQAVS